MDEKVYLTDLNCYARADEKQKKNVKESHCFDLGLLPTKGLQKEFRSFIEERSQQCALTTMIQERATYQRFCMVLKDKHIRVESLQELEWEQWLLKIRSWLLEHGQKLTVPGVSVYGKEKTLPSSLITYARKAYQFTENFRIYSFWYAAVIVDMHFFLKIIFIPEGNLFQISFYYEEVVKLQDHKNSSICCFFTSILSLNRFQISLNFLCLHFIDWLFFSIKIYQKCAKFQ